VQFDDLKWPPQALAIFSGKFIFIFAELERLQSFQFCFFTQGAVKANNKRDFTASAGFGPSGENAFGADRDKREIKNLDSAEHSQSESGGYLKSKKGYTPSLKISIPRFLPVENSLRICYDKKQRYSHKMLKMRKVIACVKVES
jgi:hypothetical protein